MSIKEFFTKLNVLTKYAPRVASIDMRMMEFFLRGLKLDITKDVVIGDHAPISYSKALSHILRLEAIKQKMVREECYISLC